MRCLWLNGRELCFGGYFMTDGIVSQFGVRVVNVQLQMSPSQDLSGFDVAVGVTRSIMVMIGAWPDPKNMEHWLLRYYFLVPISTISFFCFIPQTTLAIMVRHDFNKLLEILSTGQILIGVAILKLIGFRYNKKDLWELVSGIAKDWQESTTAKEQRIMWRNARISRLVGIVYFSTVTSCILLLSTRVILVYYVDKHRLGENASISKPLFLEAHFFFDVESNPMHQVIFVSQVLTAFYIAGCFASFDGFFVFAILHLTGQLKNLQMRLEALVDKCGKRKCALRGLFKSIIYRHQRIISLANVIERNFNKLFLAQILATSILLCLQGYQFVMVIGESRGSALYSHMVFFTVVTASNIGSLFMYCYMAEQLRTESEDLFSAAYNMKWYNLPPYESKLLIPFMAQTMKPIKLTVGKFEVFSLQYFSSILKASAGYLSMLLAVKDRL